MIFGNRVAKTKLVEQLTLVTLQTAHHGSTSPRMASPQRNHASRPVSTDFCNKIGHKRTHALQQTSLLLNHLGGKDCRSPQQPGYWLAFIPLPKIGIFDPDTR